MFDYIKKTINSQMRAGIAKTPEMQPTDVPNEVITEYAHLFQELDDISEEGLDVNEPRKLDLDIDLNGDGDVEVDTIEIGLDGNLKDIPGDASVESITSEYETMKTYDNFYEEAAKIVPRLARESDSRYAKRVSALADKMYTEYCADAEEIGAFGFTKMSITDNRVPEKINTNFGSMQDGSNGEFVSKINTYFATDNNHEITKKQLDSARLVQNGAFKNIGHSLKAYMESTYNIPSDKSVWDYCTPTALYIPKGNGDSFCVVLEYTNEVTDKREFFGWTKPVNNDKNIDQLEKVNMESFVQESHYEWKKAVVNQLIQEAAEEEMNTPKRKFSRFYQESDEPEIMQEAATNSQFNSLHYQLAKALEGKFKVSGFKRNSDNRDYFVIDGTLDDIGDIKTTVTFTGTGAKVKTVNLDGNKATRENFPNITLSKAYEAIKALFDQPKLLFAEGYIQEGIDLGTGDAGSDTDNAGGDPPPIDNSNTDQSVDTSSTSDAAPSDNPQPSDGGEAKETAAVNNVSDQIAAKIADQTKADATDDEDITFSDDTGSTDTTDDSYDDFGSNEPSTDETESVDDQLDDLDNASNDGNDEFGSDDGLDDDGSGSIENGEISDIENMSLEEIMSNASDKLKTMPLSEIKEFLNNNSTVDFQEAFILTKKNINKEVDIHLRKALGILNDNNMNIDKLLSKFKFEGRALNRVLVKAAKTKDVYSSDEQEAIKKLNSSLSELMVSLKKSNDTSYISSVKRKISDFTKQSKIVAAFVEDKMEKPVQESFLLSNINDKITKSLIPVKADMMDLYEKHQSNQLTRGRIIKKYSANVYDGVGRASNMGGDYTSWNGMAKSAKNIDSCLKLLNKALRKKDVDNVELITDLADKIDLISDYIETVIDDKNENKEYVKLIGKLSGEILELINQFIGDDESTEQEMSETSGFDEETSATPDVETADDIDADEAVEETPDEDTDTDEDTVDTDEEEVEEDDE